MYSPSPLVDSEQGCPLVLRVVGDDDAYEQREADHAAQEDEDVDVHRRRLKVKATLTQGATVRKIKYMINRNPHPVSNIIFHTEIE